MQTISETETIQEAIHPESNNSSLRFTNADIRNGILGAAAVAIVGAVAFFGTGGEQNEPIPPFDPGIAAQTPR